MSEVFLLSERQMERIEPFLPLAHGVPRVNDRRVLSGIVYIIRNGLQWKDAPQAYVLRHEPHAIGLQLDSEGWANVEALVAGAAKVGRILDIALIQAVASSSDKKRFSLSEDGLRIRAVQGHSTASVSLQHVEKEPPEFLYHGTATRFLESIRQQGLIAGARHHVHLSQDITTATAVGQRYGEPVVLKIEALRMHQQGFKFFQAENGVWLTTHVQAGFINQHSDDL